MSAYALMLANEELAAALDRERERYDALAAAVEDLCATMEEDVILSDAVEARMRACEAIIQHQRPQPVPSPFPVKPGWPEVHHDVSEDDVAPREDTSIGAEDYDLEEAAL